MVVHRHVVSPERCLETLRFKQFEDNSMQSDRSGGLTSGMHRTFNCHWSRHTDVREKMIKVRKLLGIVEQGSLTLDFSPIITPVCDVCSRYCDLRLDGVIVWDVADKDILEATSRFLKVLDVYAHDDL